MQLHKQDVETNTFIVRLASLTRHHGDSHYADNSGYARGKQSSFPDRSLRKTGDRSPFIPFLAPSHNLWLASEINVRTSIW